MNDTAHNGKISRLPKTIRDELNQRLDDGASGGPILEWLNALPAVQTMLAAEFGGVGINAQNLSNWRKGGYQDWLKQQERRNLVRELTENAGELATDAGGVEISHHFSAVLVAELAASAQAELATLTDPAERCVRAQELLQTLVRVRREDDQAGKLAIKRELRARDRAREQEEDDYRKEHAEESWAFAHAITRSSMRDSYAKPDFFSQLLANGEADSLLRGVKLDSPGPVCPVASDQGESR